MQSLHLLIAVETVLWMELHNRSQRVRQQSGARGVEMGAAK
jgi:hypothetical protein